MERNHPKASSEKNASTRPLSAWEKRRMYSQQMYQKNKSCINQNQRNPLVLKNSKCAFMTKESEFDHSTDDKKIKRNSSKHKKNESFTICDKADINDKNVHLDINLPEVAAAELSSPNLSTQGAENKDTVYLTNDNISSSNSKKRRRTSTFEKNTILINSSEESKDKVFQHELASSSKKRQRLSTYEKQNQELNAENSNKYQINEFSCKSSLTSVKRRRSSTYDKQTSDKRGKKENINHKGSAQLETKKKAGIKAQRCNSKTQHVRMTPPKPGGGNGALVGISSIKRNSKPKNQGMHIPSANCTKIGSDLIKAETAVHLGSSMHIPLDPIPKNLPVKERLRMWKERKQQIEEYNKLQNIQTQKLNRQSTIPASTKPQKVPNFQKCAAVAPRGLSKHTRNQNNPVTVRKSNSLKSSKMLVAPAKNKVLEKAKQKTSLLEKQSQGLSQKKKSVSQIRNLAITQEPISTTQDFRKDKEISTVTSNLDITDKNCNENIQSIEDVQLDTPKRRSLTFIKDRPTPGIRRVTLSGSEGNENNSETSSKKSNKFCNNSNITKFEHQNNRKGNHLIRHSISYLYRKGQLGQVIKDKRKTISSLPIKEELRIMNKRTENECNLAEGNKKQKATTPKSRRSRQKSVSFYLQDDKPDMSSHKLPKTSVRDLTLRERLEVWLDNKGHSSSQYRHLHCFGHQLSDFKRKKSLPKSPAPKVISSRVEKEESVAPSADLLGSSPLLRPRTPMKSVVDVSVEKTLTELKSLLEEGHPPSYISRWLDEICKHVPSSEDSVQFWECRALVAEKKGDYETAVEILNTALDKGVEPVEDLKSIVSSLRARIASQEENEHTTKEDMIELNGTPKLITDLSASKKRKSMATTPRQPLVDKANVFESTLIQYSLSHHKPLLQRISKNLDVEAIVTPVRRSSRLSIPSLSGKRTRETSLNSLTELPFEARQKVFFYHNDALGEQDFD
ncbi:cytoskeleton-associated protein 2-like [Limulus polyphemus]|uniref:Cytoskeleton-associated protein 2-like n=1 Tax=Limulus polyphemus TaxID=6850 RepID=A0ABM1SLU4_LIMPO|nr:cytoskeleton-associated protein 2-like [Limulus polyphemus]